ncbi:2-(5'-triphosphoribosyl)-3'-dephospho CoA synthase [Pasteurellaceae bacterium Macca]|nr:2-(5'-triphosphoribosyl)-3'-dephospho CoA synthase [Pasteurellaceae bacterium Macca]
MIFQQIQQRFSIQGEEISLDTLLAAREQRAKLQQCFLREGQSLVSLTLTAVGSVKRNPLLDWVFAKSLENLTACFTQLGVKPSREQIIQAQTGHFALFAVPLDAIILKKALIALEQQSPLARLWDLDVFSPNGELLSRNQFGLSPRKCLLCEREGKVCARGRYHSPLALQQEMQRRALAEYLSEQVHLALLEEVYLTPKPGLVDQDNNGAHRDMDLSTFERSANALRPFWSKFVRYGMMTAKQPISQILAQIRPLGLAAEEAMFAATGGINTHKGVIFAFGVICCVIGRLIELNHQTPSEQSTDLYRDVKQICATAAALCQGITAELQHEGEQPLTAGMRLFREFGLTGARGEAESGFPQVLSILPVLADKQYDWQHRLLLALLQLMAMNQDTNVAHRGGIAGLMWLQEQAKSILANKHIYQQKQEVIKQLKAFDHTCITRNLSGGGSADLLALAIFFYKLNF